MPTSHTVTCVATEMLKIVTNHRIQPLNKQTLLAADMSYMRILCAQTFISQILPANIEAELERFLKHVHSARPMTTLQRESLTRMRHLCIL